MCLPIRDDRAQRFLMTGLVFLTLANVSQLIFRHTPSIGEDLVDGIRGLLFGVAIGSLLVAIWRNGRAASR
jgi:hypothetical protein